MSATTTPLAQPVPAPSPPASIELPPPPASPVWDRIDGQIAWYGHNAKRSKRFYVRIKLVQIVAAAFIPVLAAAGLASWVLGSLGALVVVLESVQQLFQFHSNWTQYRTTCETLKHERFLAQVGAGPYAKAPNPMALLAERAETIVSQEHNAWASEQHHQGQPAAGQQG